MRLLHLVLALVLAFAAGRAEAQTFPKFTGLVVDAANVLPPEVERDLTAKLETLQRDTKRQLVVATIPDLQGYPIEDYGYRLGREWGVGLRDVDNGVILFVAPNERAGHRGPRIEVGTGLEGIITDALASTIIRERMMPRLRGGDVPGAMTAGTDALVQQLRASPEEAQARLDAAVREFDRTHRRETRANGGGGVPFGLIFWGFIFLFVVLPVLRGKGGRGRGFGGRRYRGGVDPTLPIVLWSVANEIGRSRGGWGGGGGFGGWSGGGSDGSWGGGGFTGGGGGSFSGGGASGDW